MGAIAMVLTKKLSGNYSVTQILTGFSVSAFTFNLLISLLLGESVPTLELSIPWLASIGFVFSYLIGNAFVIVGFKHLKATTGSLIGLAEILFGVFFGVLLFGEALPESTLLGGGLIILATALLHLVRMKKK